MVVPGLGGPQLSRLSYSGPSVDGAGGVVQRTERPGTGIGGQTAAQGADGDYSGTPRNAPCPCGSGRKFKRCHGDPKARARMSG